MGDRTITINVDIQYDEDKMTEEDVVEASNYLFMSSIFDKEMSDRIKEQGISHITFSKEKPVSHQSNLLFTLIDHVVLLRDELEMVRNTLRAVAKSSNRLARDRARCSLQCIDEALAKTKDV